MGIGDRIKARRALMGWSQYELAQKTGLRPATISRYESGQNKPSIDAASTLAEVLRVDLRWLVNGLEIVDPPRPVEDPAALKEFLASPIAHDLTDAETEELRRIQFKDTPTVDAYAYLLMAIRKTH